MQQRHPAISVFLLTFLAAPAVFAQSTAFSVVNAASYGSSVAPDSLATIFGSNLAQTTASATLDANGQLPTVLASTSVEINGVPAPLFYVAPGQINLVVPGGLTTGTATVLIRSTVYGSTRSGSVLVSASAPGVFTSDATGAGPGAILNAVTYLPAPFVVQTPENGADTRTRIAVYGTGLRHADSVTAQAQDTAGNYSITVEYAGAAPGFFGLDQVNLLLPPDLDGAGTVSLSLAADGHAANVITFQTDFMAQSALQLATLDLSPTFLNAGDSAALAIGLNGVARAGGFPVGLRSSNSAAQVTPLITIPQGQASAQTSVATSAVNTVQGVTITAQAGGVTQTAALEIDPAGTVQLTGLSVSPGSLPGGKSLTGTVTLGGNATMGGINIALTSDSGKVRLPAVVAVGFGKSSADFPITTLAVTSTQTVTLTATLGHTTESAAVTLLPPLALTLDASAVVGGNPVSGTVTLAEPAPVGGATVTLNSGNAAVRVPPVAIPAGQTSQTFTLTTSAVTAAQTVSITATYAGASQTVSLTVNPPAAVTLSSLTISPNQVTGGSNTQATVTLTGPAGMGGVRVDLQSSKVLTAAASPNFAIIPLGQSSVVFTITTSRFPGVVTFTATAGGVSKTANLTVQ
jgi:trimeric autotransporter adhesin